MRPFTHRIPSFLLIGFLLCITSLLNAQTADISITDYPVYEFAGDLEGRVAVDPATHKVAIYLFLPSAGGWWIKPWTGAPLTDIQPDSTWSQDVVLAGIDEYALRYLAVLVPAASSVPLCAPCGNLDSLIALYPHAYACRAPGNRVVNFAGYDWFVKKTDSMSGPSTYGPGPNHFSDDPAEVWVDSVGLHLKIVAKDTSWWSSEVVIDTSLGYGTYTFDVVGRADLFDPNIVGGIFLWDECAGLDPIQPNDYFREIDFEFSRWGDPLGLNSQFVVQPWDTPGNLHRYDMDLTGIAVSTHFFTWTESSVTFQSTWGSSTESWTYAGIDVPKSGLEKIDINLWLRGGSAPTDGMEAEFIIGDFRFTPLPLSNEGGTASIPQQVLHVFPNPSSGQFQLMLPETGTFPLTLEVFDLQGKQIASNAFLNPSQEYSLDLSSHRPGIYFIKVKGERHTWIHRIEVTQ